MRCSLVRASALALSCALFGATCAHAASVAILPLETDAPDVARKVAATLRTAVTEAPRLEDAGPVATMPDEIRMLFSCFEEQAECMAQAGGMLNAENILMGQIRKAEGGYTLDLKLLDVAAKSYARRTRADVVHPDAAALQAAARAFVLGEELRTVELTALRVTSDPPGATVFIDGAEAGQTPVTVKAEPGVHAIEVRPVDGAPIKRSVRVSGPQQEVPFVLAAKRPEGLAAAPPPEVTDEDDSGGLSTGTWLGISSAVVAVGAAGAATFFGVKVLDIQDEAEQTDDPDELDSLESDFDSAQLGSNVSWGVAGVAAAASVYFFFFHDDEPGVAVAPTGDGLLLHGRF